MKRLLLPVFLIFTFIAAPAHEESSLDGAWSLKFFPQGPEAVTTPAQADAAEGVTIPATVPGNVEIDLQAAGLIADPMVGRNIYLLRKWEGYQWCYRKTFTAPSVKPGQRSILSFGGVDTFAEIWLNGQKVGSGSVMI